MERGPESLEEILDLLEKDCEEKGRISVDMALEELGRRSFGPILLMAGLITLAPVIGDIPGMPTLIGVLVMLTSGQLLIRKEHIWLPQWLTRRSMKREKFCRALAWLRSPAHYLDYLARPRLSVLIEGGGIQVIALICFLVAACMPVMEFIPFSANAAGFALTIFGLSLIANDGLIALLALAALSITIGLILYHFVL